MGRVLAAAVAAVLLVVPLAAARADVLLEALELRRQVQYEEAAARLVSALPGLGGEDRCRGLVALAGLVPEHKEARRLLLDAAKAATDPETRRRADLELARLDYARGNYRSVATRLEPWRDDPEACLWLGLAATALGETSDLEALVAPARKTDLAALLVGWAALEAGEPKRALDAVDAVARRRHSDLLPTALLWKAQCETALGQGEQAQATRTTLRERFPDSPEAILARDQGRPGGGAATGPRAEPPAERVVLQIGAFQDRTNALRFRAGLEREFPGVRVIEAYDRAARLYRIHIGPFASRQAAEAFGHEQLAPRGHSWQVARAAEERP